MNDNRFLSGNHNARTYNKKPPAYRMQVAFIFLIYFNSLGVLG